MRTDAVYQDGVFKPLTPVTFRDNQRVSLDIEPLEQEDARDWSVWLEETERLRNQIAAEYGILPDSTLDIAEDRAR